jgi:environmental stress-induced protein Ves
VSWHVIHLDDVQAAPWRNGGGMTRELAAWPAQGEWQWRMSVAEVWANGPFSCFDGVTRWFAVLQGAGVVLNVRTPSDSGEVGASEHHLTVQEPPLCFDGAAATDCQLISGPTRDFNLMVRNSGLPARMLRVRGDFQTVASATKTIAVYAINSGARVRFNAEKLYVPPTTLVWRRLSKAATVEVHASHALWMEVSA